MKLKKNLKGIVPSMCYNNLCMKANFDFFAILHSKMALSAIIRNSTEHEIDNISIAAEWILIIFVSKDSHNELF